METKEIICVVCPSSCRVSVTGDGKSVRDVAGFACRRGDEYARNEYLAPVRILTSIARAEGYVSPVISVRSDRPVPKDLQFKCVDEIRKISVKAPFEVGRVVVENIMGCGVNIVLSNC